MTLDRAEEQEITLARLLWYRRKLRNFARAFRKIRVPLDPATERERLRITGELAHLQKIEEKLRK